MAQSSRDVREAAVTSKHIVSGMVFVNICIAQQLVELNIDATSQTPAKINYMLLNECQ